MGETSERGSGGARFLVCDFGPADSREVLGGKTEVWSFATIKEARIHSAQLRDLGHRVRIIGPGKSPGKRRKGTGVGKSYIASALAHAACRADFSVRCYRLPRLIEELARYGALQRRSALYRQLAKADLIVIDDFGIAPLGAQERLTLTTERALTKACFSPIVSIPRHTPARHVPERRPAWTGMLARLRRNSQHSIQRLTVWVPGCGDQLRHEALPLWLRRFGVVHLHGAILAWEWLVYHNGSLYFLGGVLEGNSHIATVRRLQRFPDSLLPIMRI